MMSERQLDPEGGTEIPYVIFRLSPGVCKKFWPLFTRPDDTSTQVHELEYIRLAIVNISTPPVCLNLMYVVVNI